MALALLTFCYVLISCYIATPPAGGVCCSNHPQLYASVSRFWTFAILWKLPLFFLSCANTVQWLISFRILGAHLFEDCILTTQPSGKNTQEKQPSPFHPLAIQANLQFSAERDAVLTCIQEETICSPWKLLHPLALTASCSTQTAHQLLPRRLWGFPSGRYSFPAQFCQTLSISAGYCSSSKCLETKECGRWDIRLARSSCTVKWILYGLFFFFFSLLLSLAHHFQAQERVSSCRPCQRCSQCQSWLSFICSDKGLNMHR